MVGQFFDFKMVDSKTVISQVQKIQVILHEFQAKGMILSETFQVTVIIEKLPLGWKDFNNYLKHKRKEMNLEKLIVNFELKKTMKVQKRKGSIFLLLRQMLWSMSRALKTRKRNQS